VDAIAAVAGSVGMTARLSDFGIGAEHFAQIAADALDDEVLAKAPRQPTSADIGAILAASGRDLVNAKG
jgi:alcohol dehydrogenase class IV